MTYHLPPFRYSISTTPFQLLNSDSCQYVKAFSRNTVTLQLEHGVEGFYIGIDKITDSIYFFRKIVCHVFWKMTVTTFFEGYNKFMSFNHCNSGVFYFSTKCGGNCFFFDCRHYSGYFVNNNDYYYSNYKP